MRAIFCLTLFAGIAFADAGVLVPAGHDQPDASIFSLNEMTVEIRFDNGIGCGAAYLWESQPTDSGGHLWFRVACRGQCFGFRGVG